MTGRFTTAKAALIHDYHYEEYLHCAALYEQEKYEACIFVGVSNIGDWTSLMAGGGIPGYLEIKTLILFVRAERKLRSNWFKVEVSHHLCLLKY